MRQAGGVHKHTEVPGEPLSKGVHRMFLSKRYSIFGSYASFLKRIAPRKTTRRRVGPSSVQNRILRTRNTQKSDKPHLLTPFLAREIAILTFASKTQNDRFGVKMTRVDRKTCRFEAF